MRQLSLRAILIFTAAPTFPGGPPHVQEGAPGGVVTSAAGVPIPNAMVRVTQTGQTTRTGVDGRFRWPGARSGAWDVSIRALGFQAAVFHVTADSGRLAPNTFQLRPIAQQLDSVVIRASPQPPSGLAEFERRRLVGFGRYFTAADFAGFGATRMSSLLRMLPAGIIVQDSSGTPLAVSRRGRKLVQDGGQFFVVPCVLRTAIDGQLQPWGTSLDVVDPGEIAGIEVYLGASSIPAEFAAAQRDQFCGLLVFWTRRAPPRSERPDNGFAADGRPGLRLAKSRPRPDVDRWTARPLSPSWRPQLKTIRHAQEDAPVACPGAPCNAASQHQAVRNGKRE